MSQLTTFIEKLKKVSGFNKKEKLKDSENKGFHGWVNFPMSCLKLLLENPYVFDLMKEDVLKWEFNNNLERKVRKYREEKYLGSLAGFAGHYVDLS